MTQLPFNVYGVRHGCQEIGEDRWAIVSNMDKKVAFVNTKDAKIETTLRFDLGAKADGALAASVTRRAGDELLVFTSEPRAGVRADLAKREVVGRELPTACR